jgi:predicted RNA-binding protein with PUA-like domain
MAYWLVKSDPDTYGFADLERDRKTVWDGVLNALALQHLRKVRKGDSVLVYHSGAEKAIVGIAKAASDAYPDPKAADEKLAVFEIQVVRRLKEPVTLADIKADKKFAQFELVRMSRLSVMPVPPVLYERLTKMGGEV